MDRPPKIALVGSSGGHLAHLLVLRPWWSRYDRFWVTFDTRDATEALSGERTYWCYYPTNRHIPNLLRNAALAWRILRHERPTVIVSSGAAVAVPFFYIGKLVGARTMFVEVVDRVTRPTLTGRLVRRVTDRMLVQWPEQRKLYRGGKVIGRLL